MALEIIGGSGNIANVDANDQLYVNLGGYSPSNTAVGTWSSSTPVNNSFVLVNGLFNFGTLIVTLNSSGGGTITAGVVVVEVSNDNSNYVPIQGVEPNTLGALIQFYSLQPNTYQALQYAVAGWQYIRLRLSTAIQGTGNVVVGYAVTQITSPSPVQPVAVSGVVPTNSEQLNGVALGSPSNYGTSPGAVSVPGVNAFVTNTVAVSQSGSPWGMNLTQLDGAALGAPSNYGTSPGAVAVQGVNAFITNVPAVSQSGTWNVTVNTALPAGGNTIGAVNQGTSPWVVSLTSTTITGTVAVTQSTSPWVVDGNLTHNNAAPAATNVGALVGVASSAAPSYTAGDQVLLSTDLLGNTRVTLTTALPAGGNTIGAVSQASGPWTQNLTQVDGVALGAPSAYGTSPGAVNVIGVNAFITNVPAVSQSGTWNIGTVAAVTAITNALPAGANTIGAVTQASGPWTVNETQLAGSALGAPSNYGTSPGAVAVQGVNAFVTNTVAVTMTSTTITGTVAVTQSTSPWVVDGNLTHNNAAPAANNVGALVAVASSAAPTYTAGDQVLLSTDLSGNTRVTLTTALPAGANTIGAVTQASGPWTQNLTQVDGVALGAPSAYGTSPGAVTVVGVNAFITNVPAVSQSGTWNVTVNTALPAGSNNIGSVNQGTSPWVVSLTSTTITGTVAVTQSTSPWVVDGNLTHNNAAPAATNVGALVAVASAAAPTYTAGDQVLLSTDLAGNTRVTLTTALPAGANTIGAVNQGTSPWVTNVTQWDSTALGAPSAYGTSPGAVNVIGVNAFITNTVAVTLASTTITGTVAVTQSTSPWVVSLTSTTITGTVAVAGALTNNNAAPTATLLGVLPAIAETAYATVTYTTGDMVLPVTDLHGALNEDLQAWAGTALGAPTNFGTTPGAVVAGSVNSSVFIGTTVAVAASAGVQKVGISGATGVTLDAVITAATAPANALATLSVYQATQPSLTTGQSVALQNDSAGNLQISYGCNVTTGATLPTALNSVQYITGTTTIGAPIGKPVVVIQLVQTTTITAGAVTFEGTYDGTNWVTIPVAQVVHPETFALLTNPYTLVASTNQPFMILMQGYQNVRIRVSTAITGTGTITPQWDSRNHAPLQTVAVAASTAGSLLSATGSIGATKTAIKTAAGSVYGWYFYNSNTTVAYVQFFANTVAGVTLGTTAPFMSLGIPPQAGANVLTDVGIAFATAITIAITTTRAGATGPTNTVDYNVFYL